MTSPAPILNLGLARYEALKQACDIAHEKTHAAWAYEVQAVFNLLDSGTWYHLAKNREDYCKQYLPYAYSTYRQYKTEAPIALMVADYAELSKVQARTLRERVNEICEDEKLIPETLYQAYKYTESPIPTEGELKATYELVERYYHQNAVEINGIEVSTKSALSFAVGEAIYENQERQKLHIETNSKTIRRNVDMPQNEAIQALFDYSSKGSKTISGFRISWNELKPIEDKEDENTSNDR